MDDAMKLPASVQEIADVIGREQALLLVGALPRCYSGQKGKTPTQAVMYVPTLPRLGLDHRLVQIVGWNSAVKLCKAFGGEIMYPATCSFLVREFRNQSILEMARRGMKAAMIALEVGVCERTVRNLMKENPLEVLPDAANDNALIDNMATA